MITDLQSVECIGLFSFHSPQRKGIQKLHRFLSSYYAKFKLNLKSELETYVFIPSCSHLITIKTGGRSRYGLVMCLWTDCYRLIGLIILYTCAVSYLLSFKLLKRSIPLGTRVKFLMFLDWCLLKFVYQATNRSSASPLYQQSVSYMDYKTASFFFSGIKLLLKFLLQLSKIAYKWVRENGSPIVLWCLHKLQILMV